MNVVRCYRLISIGLLFVVLAAVRFFEEVLFYDPLLYYFESDYLEATPLPAFNFFKLLFSLSFRYWLNSVLSLLILYIAFRKTDIVRFTLILMTIAYFILVPFYGYILKNYDPEHYIALFYTRRFLIQPVLILLLLPAFYYQSKQKE